MRDGFVIMQIGNRKLDQLYHDVYHPTIVKAGYTPVRVDVCNDGTLIKSQIVRYLQDSELIIADLTNERPNCYLEVGIAMGLNRYDRLILCCREDHNPDIRIAKKYKGKKKVPFDLSGYGIVWWDQKNLEVFRKELQDEIQRRMNLVEQKRKSVSPRVGKPRDINAWVKSRRQEARQWKIK